MRDWRAEVARRLEGAGLGPEEERSVADELVQHLEDRYQDLLAGGATPEAAARDTLDELDGPERLRAALRRPSAPPAPALGEARGGAWGALGGDLRFALRQLRRAPLIAAATVLTLALGIGANAAVFSVISAVLLEEPPFAEMDRLVVVWETDRDSETSHEPASWPDILDFRERAATLGGVEALMGADATLSGAGAEAVRLSAMRVTPGLLPLLGVVPLAGRLFDAEVRGGAPRDEVLLSEGAWRARYGGDPGIIGTSIRVNERPHTVVGVVPASADLGLEQVHARADYSAPFPGGRVDAWLPLAPTAEEFPRETHPFLAIGRLRDGVSLPAAQREIERVAAELEAEHAENRARGVYLQPLDEVVFGGVRPALRLLLGAVGMLLLITCANVASLLLARGTARRREVATRRALGASTSRMVRQFLAESVVVTALGAAAGLALAWGGLALAKLAAPPGVPRLDEATLDARVLAFVVVVGAVVSLVFGVIPALQLRGADPAGLAASAGRGTPGRAARAIHGSLVVGQIGLAVALAVGAGLVLRSVWALQRVDLGFDASRVVKAHYALPPARYPFDFARWPELTEISSFHTRLLERARSIPGVEAAALASAHPLDPGSTNSFAIVGREAESRHFPEIRMRIVTPGYLRTLSVPLVAGRDLAAGDDTRAPRVLLLNRAAAERYFPGGDPIGEEIAFWGLPWRVVGVVGDERFRGTDAEVEPAVYVAYAQAPRPDATLLARTTGDPAAALLELRRALHALDPQVALYGAEPLPETIAASIGRPRFAAVLLSAFGGLAVALALIGVHGILAFSVGQRRGEMAVRMALGATRARVARVVLAQGARLALAGVAVGLALALGVTRLVRGFLFGVTPLDAPTYALVACAVLATALAASWLPARRATRTEPMQVLRAE